MPSSAFPFYIGMSLIPFGVALSLRFFGVPAGRSSRGRRVAPGPLAAA